MKNQEEMIEKRKDEHISLALSSQTATNSKDLRFYYEPLLGVHPSSCEKLLQCSFFGKELKAPLWISSMTGGAKEAKIINQNLALVAGKLGLGMGLGSCRIFMEDPSKREDFSIRKYIGDKAPLYGNLGIAQVERLLETGQTNKLNELFQALELDGIFIHINPLQEWFQEGGDRFRYPPLETIQRLLDKVDVPFAVKEVGQGMGPQSLEALMNLPLKAIEFASYGGTNFSLLESKKAFSEDDMAKQHSGLLYVGHTGDEMVGYVNSLLKKKKKWNCQDFILSGGIKNYLDGYYLSEKLKANNIIGLGSVLLPYARKSEEHLMKFLANEIEGLKMANKFLKCVE